MNQHPSQQFSPSLNGPCLCGSGKKFKRCCSAHYKGREPGRSPHAAFERGDYDAALRECRADITQYTIWHKSHTEPAYRDGFSGIFPLMNTDIRAMGELVNLLFYSYQKLDSMDEFPTVLERLRTNINEERWQRKITYFHALCALWPNWNRQAGRRELKRLGSVNDETDPEILQLYIDLFGAELPFSKMIALVERAIQISETRIDTFHYRCLRAVQYLLIGDEAEAEQELDEAIADFRTDGTDDLTSYESFRFAMGVHLFGGLRDDSALLNEALDLLQLSRDTGDWSPEGNASVLRSIGDIRLDQKKWGEALEAYESSWQLDAIPIYSVFASQCLLRLDRADDAAQRLLNIDLQKLSPGEYADYAFAFAAVAIETGVRDFGERAEQQLRDLSLKEPYFRERRDQILLDLLNSRETQATSSIIAKVRKLLGEILGRSRQYLILQPNILGVGIDLNKIADDLTAGSDMHKKEPPKIHTEQDSK